MALLHKDISIVKMNKTIFKKASLLADKKLGWGFDNVETKIKSDFTDSSKYLIVENTTKFGSKGGTGVLVTSNYSNANYEIISETKFKLSKICIQKYMNFYDNSHEGSVVRNFVKKGSDNIYDRYGYITSYRWRTIFVGEAGEEACREVLEGTGLNPICYNDIREDGFKHDDKFDFKIGNFAIDIKTSCDNNNHGFDNLLRKYHLIVPEDQSIKDITIQVILNKEMNLFWIIGWLPKDEIQSLPPRLLGMGPQRGGRYFQVNLNNCRPISELKSYLKGK